MSNTTKTTKEIKDSMEEFGPIVTIEKPTTVKVRDLRDYQKTPEVNKLLEQYGSKSAAIRALHKKGLNRSQIANELRVVYQFVNNVLNQKTK
jgi:hypothetical protein